MAEKKGLIDRLAEMPKGKLIVIAVVVFAVAGFAAVYFGFGFYKKPAPEETGPVLIDMPDADVEDYNKTRMQAYRDADMDAAVSAATSDSYWDSLGDDLVSEKKEDYLDPAVYSSLEIYQIQKGIRTKADVDREHAEEAARAQRLGSALHGDGNPYPSGPSYGSSYGPSAAPPRPMTQEQRDSAYFARIEKAYQMAAKYSTSGAAQEQSSPEDTTSEEDGPAKEEVRTIDLSSSPSSLPSESFDGDGIITSLVGAEDGDVVHYAGAVNSKPVKATFLKNETLTDGQRVIIRLMQDMTLSNGTTIPANTHITGTANFSSRLRINVTMLHYNGRMFPTDISVYDNDGTEGIYCPTVADGEKKKRTGKRVANDAAQVLGTVAGTLLTGNPFLGRVATSGLQAATSSVAEDGTVTVRVTSGYEFYVFENKKDNK